MKPLAPSGAFFEFIDGMRFCKEGIEHKSTFTEYQTRGYNYQYQLEQCNEHQSTIKTARRIRDRIQD